MAGVYLFQSQTSLMLHEDVYLLLQDVAIPSKWLDCSPQHWSISPCERSIT